MIDFSHQLLAIELKKLMKLCLRHQKYYFKKYSRFVGKICTATKQTQSNSKPALIYLKGISLGKEILYYYNCDDDKDWKLKILINCLEITPCNNLSSNAAYMCHFFYYIIEQEQFLFNLLNSFFLYDWNTVLAYSFLKIKIVLTKQYIIEGIILILPGNSCHNLDMLFYSDNNYVFCQVKFIDFDTLHNKILFAFISKISGNMEKYQNFDSLESLVEKFAADIDYQKIYNSFNTCKQYFDDYFNVKTRKPKSHYGHIWRPKNHNGQIWKLNS
ncbi:hypothetical protein RFI_27719 [Reticulomyxa filosa]|uniref:Uncharacterized protein n=1 Tax=Reticulomyxa filosa TaxID=46433 RepID=X6M866_RETFI|nr:hypothetical protein RFI_27719 [Reticulomyxa filosa]|eukprot:ETO09657.1 hypothetical protein RFI_27719 [Reticulomyxa filosa]